MAHKTKQRTPTVSGSNAQATATYSNAFPGGGLGVIMDG